MTLQFPITTLESLDGSIAVTPKSPGIIDLRVISGTGGGGIPGTVQNGVTDDLPALNAAVAQLAGAKASWVVFGVLLCNGNPTIPSNVSLSFLPGGMIKTTANKTIAYQSIPNASLGQQIFDISNGGVSVTMTPGKILECSGEWFGAIGDATGVALSTNAFKSAIAFAHGAGDINIRCFPVQYNIDDTLPLCNGSFSHPNLIGCAGRKKTIFSYPNLASGLPCIKMKGGSGQLTGNYVANIEFLGNANSIAIEFNGQCGSWAENCYFDANAVGVRWHNELSGSFTEFCTIRGCEFRGSCTLPREYKVTAGNNSMHGSGSDVSKCVYNIGAGPYVKFGPGCFVYNSPIYDQIFATTADAILFQNNTNSAPFAASLAGKLSLETNTSRTITLGAGQPTYLVGTPVQAIGLVTATGVNVVAGSVLRVDTHTVYQDGSSSFTGAKSNQQMAFTTGANTVASSMASTCRQVDIVITASNYDYRYILAVDRDATGGAGFVSTIATLRTFNTAGYGAPTFSVDTSGRLVVTNAGFPASGVSAYVSESQLSAGLQGAGHIQF